MQGLKYQKVVDWITEEISAGRLSCGDRLIAEEKMSEKFGLSRQTVRRATQILVDQKILTRIQGSGTYIGEPIPKIRRNNHMNVAVLSTFYESYIFPRTLRGIEKTLSKAGYATQVSFTDNKVLNERRILEGLLRKDNIDGLIVEPSRGALPNRNIKFYKELMSRHIPIIFFNDVYPELEAPCVRLDDEAVAEDAAKMLIRSGHKKIAGVFKLDDGQGHRRYSGFMDAMGKADLKIDQRHIFWVDTDAQMDLWELEDYLFRRIEGCSGIVCYNDEVAMQVIELALKRGIRVPEELSVVGIDDSDLSELCKVRITSYPHPKEKLGEKAAKNLLKMIENPMYDGNYIFSAEAVMRDSICKI